MKKPFPLGTVLWTSFICYAFGAMLSMVLWGLVMAYFACVEWYQSGGDLVRMSDMVLTSPVSMLRVSVQEHCLAFVLLGGIAIGPLVCWYHFKTNQSQLSA